MTAGPDAPSADLRRSDVKVRFHELDPYGHVNHGVYLNYFEAARTEVLDDLGFGLGVLRERGLHIVVVEVTVRFRVPALAGDVLTVETEVGEMRRASSTWRQRLLRDDTVIAEADVRAALDDLRAALGRLRAP